MKSKDWKKLVQQAVREVEAGRFEKLDLLSKHLEMCDEAKQELRNKGYGWTGLDVLETVKQVPAAQME